MDSAQTGPNSVALLSQVMGIGVRRCGELPPPSCVRTFVGGRWSQWLLGDPGHDMKDSEPPVGGWFLLARLRPAFLSVLPVCSS